MKTFLAVFLIALYGSVLVLARPVGIEEAEGIQSSKLLQASFIVVGQVDGIKDAGQAFLKDGMYPPMAVLVSKASVNVLQVIKGELIKTFQITNFLGAANSVDYVKLQVLEPNETYVFFLTKPTDAEFDPISPYQFALPLEISLEQTNTNISVKEMLRNIAKSNVAATNNLVASTWSRFLSELYDNNEDLNFWIGALNDNRLAIRSMALATLAEHAPQTPGLYSEVVKFLNSTTDSDGFLIQQRLFQLFPKLVPKEGLSVVDLQNWINGESKEFKRIALEYIRKRNDVRLLPDVVRLIEQSDDRQIQYECLKTLYVLSGNPNYISYPIFMKQPDQDIKDWQKLVATPPKTD